MAGQEQSPLQERDRRFEAGLLQQRVSNEPRWRKEEILLRVPDAPHAAVEPADHV
jgi:hypothetical protein